MGEAKRRKQLDPLFGLIPQGIPEATELLRLMFKCALEPQYAKPGAIFKVPIGGGQAQIRFVDLVGISHPDVLQKLQSLNFDKERAFVWVDHHDHYVWAIALEKLLQFKDLLNTPDNN